MTRTSDRNVAKSAPKTRKDRLKAALRANLQRRKQQVRARATEKSKKD